MGCGQSKIETDETVIRCKDRKQFMKEAVSARNAFAAAHSAYAVYLKNTGAALSDFAEGEVDFSSTSASVSATALPVSSTVLPTSQPSYENIRPPPPLPDFTPPPLQRSATMPEFVIAKPDFKQSESIIEEENEEDEQVEVENHAHGLRHRVSRSSGGVRAVEEVVLPTPPLSRAPPMPAPPMPAPQPMSSTWDFFFPDMENVPRTNLDDEQDTHDIQRKVFEEMSKRDETPTPEPEPQPELEPEPEPDPEPVQRVAELPPQPPPPVKAVKKMRQAVPTEAKRVGKGVGEMNLLQIFNYFDDCFLKASESAHEVSKMLEATRLHYHSNFADNRGHIDHSARVMRVITWNRSFRGQLNLPEDTKDDFESEENETHATVLDKMLAWEKKLYDEVKAGEQMKHEYQRKVGSLTKLKKKGTNTEALERTKAAVSHLHTRYIVDMQAMDSTVSEINRLRDEQLYPKLVALVDGMATMWDTMKLHHESQSKMVRFLRSLDISPSPKETTEQHHNRTVQLWNVVREWHSQFDKLMMHQKDYMKALNNWLKLNLVPIDNNLREKVSSPQRPQNPPIQSLLLAWHDLLEKLPEELARTAIQNFTAVVDTIVQYQVEEVQMMRKCKDTQNELERKRRHFEDWHSKYMQRRTPPDEVGADGEPDKDENVVERQMAVEMLQHRLEEETEAYRKQCIQVREKSLTTLKTRLPELFRAMSEFSLACSDMYKDLKSVSDPHYANESS